MEKSKSSNPLDNIKVTAFIGEAGTGKSQRAQLIARKNNIDYVIDDGLVVSRGRIMTGKSAKSENNLIRAIRRALFQFPDHRELVVDFLKKRSPINVMIIATSESMAKKIAKNLGIKSPERFIFITDVATQEEIKTARMERQQRGHHVIPVSHAQIRKNFGGKLVGHLRELWKPWEKHDGERTVVRPPFSFYGSLKIDIMALSQIAEHVTRITTQVEKVEEVKVKTVDERLSFTVHVHIRADDKNLMEVSRLIQKRVFSAVSYFTGMETKTVNVRIEEVLFQ